MKTFINQSFGSDNSRVHARSWWNRCACSTLLHYKYPSSTISSGKRSGSTKLRFYSVLNRAEQKTDEYPNSTRVGLNLTAMPLWVPNYCGYSPNVC